MRLSPDALRLAVPVMALVALLAGVFWLRPNAAGYAGLNLLFNYAVPIALATLAQMIIMSVNDLDLSMGAFVSFVACVTATYLNDTPLTGVLILMASVAAYAVIGVVIHLRNLPAIVVTLGMSFVWAGLAVLILPAPGGVAPRLGARGDDGQAAADADGHRCVDPDRGLRTSGHHAVVVRRADPGRRGK